ncbi:MAG: ThuA domain-containing protein [Armatimonadota bacterium]
MTDQQEQVLADFVGGGCGFLALHNSTALRCIDDTPTLYRDVLGSSYSGHGPADEHFEVRIEDAGHFVAAGVKDYPAVDERHWPVMHTDDATILTRAYSDTGTSVNGYVRTYGKGRVCYLANGHTAEMLGCDSMQTLMNNATRWCSGRDVDGI